MLYERLADTFEPKASMRSTIRVSEARNSIGQSSNSARASATTSTVQPLIYHPRHKLERISRRYASPGVTGYAQYPRKHAELRRYAGYAIKRRDWQPNHDTPSKLMIAVSTLRARRSIPLVRVEGWVVFRQAMPLKQPFNALIELMKMPSGLVNVVTTALPWHAPALLTNEY